MHQKIKFIHMKIHKTENSAVR